MLARAPLGSMPIIDNVSDKVLVLLPTKANKLLTSWKGPFEVVEKLRMFDDSSESLYKDMGSLVESTSVSDYGEFNDININPDLTVVRQAHVREIISDYSITFTTRHGCTMLIEHDIKLTTDTPVRVKQYPLLFVLWKP